MVDSENLCLGCMESRETDPRCPRCGWVSGGAPLSPIFLLPGTVLQEKYLIGKALGQGGFGITYLAYDLNLEVKLAIKEYLPVNMATRSEGHSQVSVFPGDSEARFHYGLNQFLGEAKKLAQFEDHPGIVSVRDYFEANGTAYFVMHYVDGLSFKELLRRKGGRLPYSQAAGVMVPVIRSLGHVHRTGLLHRDVSPDNIYITANGQVKLLDFGAARYSTGEKSLNLSVILKPGFAPEEQYRSNGHQGPWTDVYAAAGTLYSAILGRKPPEALERLNQDQLVPPSRMGVDIPVQAEAALMKALSVRAEDRFQEMDEFLKALSGDRDQDPLFFESSTAEPPSVESPFVPPTVRESSAGVDDEPTVVPDGGADSTTMAEPPNAPTPSRVRVRPWFVLAAVAVLAMGVFSVQGLDYYRSWRARTTPVEIGRFPIKNLVGVVEKKAVAFDPQETSDGDGSLRFEAGKPQKIRLYDLGNLDIEAAAVFYRGRMKTRDFQGRAHLEMICEMADREQFRSLGLQAPLDGTTEWSTQETPFYVEPGRRLTRVSLWLAAEGQGKVWIDDIRLVRGPLPPEGVPATDQVVPYVEEPPEKKSPVAVAPPKKPPARKKKKLKVLLPEGCCP